MIHTLLVQLRLTIHSEENGFLDENSVKSLINQGTAAIADNVTDLTVVGESETSPDSINVQVVGLKVNGKRQSLLNYGTEDVLWGRD